MGDDVIVAGNRRVPGRTGRRLARWLIILCAAAPGAHAYDLLHAYQSALDHDPRFRAARVEAEAEREQRVIARAGLLPRVAFTYQNALRNWQDGTIRDVYGNEQQIDRDYASYVGTLSLRQPLYDPAAWARWRQGQIAAVLADDTLRDAAQSLMLRVATAYTDALYAREQAALARAQARAYAEQRARNERAYVLGDGTRTDVAQTEARLALAQAETDRADDEADAALQVLRDTTGDAGVTLDALAGLRAGAAESVAQDGRIGPFEDWRALALQHNALLAAQAGRVAAASQEVRRQRAAHLPRLELYAQHAANRADVASTYNQRYRTRSIGVVLSLPIYSGGGTAAAERQAALREQSARHQMDDKSNDVLRELRKRHRLSAGGPARIAAQRDAVRAAAVALEGSRRGVEAGERINLDVLDAAQRYYGARRDLARTLYDTLNARLALRYYAGTLRAEDLYTLAGHFGERGIDLSSAAGRVDDSSQFPPTADQGK